mgnify:CR=1 FL=1
MLSVISRIATRLRSEVAAWLVLCCLSGASWGATYTFPGSLPVGCVQASTGVYTCASWTPGTADVFNVTGTASITVTGNLNIQGGQFNVGGSASNVALTVVGIFSASNGAKLYANLNATSVSSSGVVYYGGSITTATGGITLGGSSTVVGAITSTSGAVLLGSGTSSAYTTVASITTGGTVTLNSYPKVLGTTTGSLVSAATGPWFGGDVTATATYVSFGTAATVTGNVVAASYVYTGTNSNISGYVTSGTLQVDLVGGTTVGGAITANGTYVNFGIGSSAGGNVVAKSYVDLGTDGVVNGNVKIGRAHV